MREKLYAFPQNGKLFIQPAPYQDDGWYIVNQGVEWLLYEINAFGGIDERICTESTFDECYKRVSELT